MGKKFTQNMTTVFTQIIHWDDTLLVIPRSIFRIETVSKIEDAFEVVDDPLFIGGARIITSIFDSNLKFKIHTIYKTTFNHMSNETNSIKLDIDLIDQDRIAHHSSKSNVKSMFGTYDMKVSYETFKRIKEPNYEYDYLNEMKQIVQHWPRMTRNGLARAPVS